MFKQILALFYVSLPALAAAERVHLICIDERSNLPKAPSTMYTYEFDFEAPVPGSQKNGLVNAQMRVKTNGRAAAPQAIGGQVEYSRAGRVFTFTTTEGKKFATAQFSVSQRDGILTFVATNSKTKYICTPQAVTPAVQVISPAK